MARPRTRSQVALDAAERGFQGEATPHVRRKAGGKVRWKLVVQAGGCAVRLLPRPPVGRRPSHRAHTHNQNPQAHPLLPPFIDELPSMALLTLLYFMQAVPLGLTMGSV